MSTPSAPSVDVGAFKRTTGRFATGVAVVTGCTDDGPVGITCQSFVSLSLDPPLVLFCPTSGSYAWSQIEASAHFCVNLLCEEQQDLCMRFASKVNDRFDGVAWHRSATGSPILDGALSWMDCRIEDVHPGGDHVIVVGEVLELDAPEGRSPANPLVYYGGGFGRLVTDPAA